MPDKSKCQIRIYDPDFNWIAETSQAESVQFTRELYGTGSFEIHIHPDKTNAIELIKRGNIIVINRDGHKSGIIRDFYIEETRGKSEFVIYGDTGSGMTKQRITVPPTQDQNVSALGWDRINVAAESVIKHYANMNLVTPYDSARTMPNLMMADDQERGAVIPWQSRYNKLDEELYNVCSYSEIGYEIYADTANKKWIFDCIIGTDRSKAQNIVSPVSFSMAYQNIDSYRYVEDYQNYKNTGYAGGSGEDENRLVYTIGSENTGTNRWETFLDCGSAADINELIYYGGQKMNEYKEAKTVEASALPKVFIFEQDYFLGDIVTLSIPKIGVSIHTRITSVKEIWERPSGYKTEARFGGKVPNLLTMLNKSKEVR